jgi:pre-mycofactocin synthase
MDSAVRQASKISTVDDARYLARRYLPEFLYRLYTSGTQKGLTADENSRAFDEIHIVPRAAAAYESRSLARNILGFDLSMPVLLAPVGSLRLGRPGEGEIAVARAAGAEGTAFSLSSFTGYSIEEVADAASGPMFCQMNLFGDRRSGELILERARNAGCGALVVVVDNLAPGGNREYPMRERVHIPSGLSPLEALLTAPQLVRRLPWLTAFVRDGMPSTAPMAIGPAGAPMPIPAALDAQRRNILVWEDFKWIREQWPGPLVVKGIMRPDDALRARDIGAEAIVVSNHGGNHIDGALPTIRVLPAIAASAGRDMQIILDSGVRRGSDVVKALALGADAVQIGRAYVYALMAGGEAGVRRILSVFREGIDVTLASLGCQGIDQLDRSYVDLPASWGA